MPTNGGVLDAGKARMRSIDFSVADDDGEGVADGSIRRDGDTFICDVDAPPAYAERVAQRLPADAIRTAKNTHTRFKFTIRATDQFAAVETLNSLFDGHETHVLHTYVTGNTDDMDPFHIIEDAPGSLGLVVYPGDEGVQEAYMAALRKSGLCSGIEPLKFGDVGVILTKKANRNREAAFLELAACYIRVQTDK